MSKKEEFDLFQTLFIGEFVEVITPMYRKLIEGDESGVSDETIPLAIQGYVLDQDDLYLYIGDTPEEITTRLFKEDARIIRIIKDNNPFDEILDNLRTPNKGEEN